MVSHLYVCFADHAEFVFLASFICEGLLKMYGLGLQLYFQSSFNIFDCVVSCRSINSFDNILVQLLNFLFYCSRLFNARDFFNYSLYICKNDVAVSNIAFLRQKSKNCLVVIFDVVLMHFIFLCVIFLLSIMLLNR